MSEDVQEWIQKYDDDPMVISVSDPESKSGGFFGKRKTLYVVRASSREKLTSVSRVYKDFVLLNTILAERFRGACIPPVPPEKMMGSTNEDFITKRMHLLEYFLQAIVENPFLRTDTTFDLFISRNEDFEKVLKGFDKNSESQGVTMWRKALDSVVQPAEPEKLLREVDKELDVVLKSLRTLKDAAKSHVASIVKYAESTRTLAHAFESWQAREEANISEMRGVMTRVDGSKAILAHELKAIVQGTSATASVIELEYGASQMELIVVDAIRFEIAQAERWKTQINETQVKLKTHVRSTEIVEGLQKQLGSLTSKSGHNEKQVTLLTTKLADAKQMQKDALAERRDYERGILSVELERYRKQRTIRIETMAALLTRTHLRGANMIKCAWDGTGLEMETNGNARQGAQGSGSSSSFFRRKSLTRTPSGRLRVRGAESRLEEELRREASTMAAPRNLAIQQDEHRVTLKAKKDYVAKKKDELDLTAGETVTAVRIDDELWYATNASGRSGLVPSSYVGVPISDSRPVSMMIPSPTNSISDEQKSDSDQTPTSRLPPLPPTASPMTSAPPGMAPPLPPGVPPLPPPSRDPTSAPPLPSDEGHFPGGPPAPPRPPQLPEFMTRKGSGVFNAELPPLPKNVEAMAALKAKLQAMMS